MSDTVQIPPEIDEGLNECAEQTGRSRGDLIVAALREYLERHGSHAWLQRQANQEIERMKRADRKDPNANVYLRGDKAWD